MRHSIHAITLLMLTTSIPPATFAAETDIAAGKALFDRWCAECHAPGHGHPGTQQLERLRGAKLAQLESRNDLNAMLIRYVARRGQNTMPAYRPSEITDTGLDQIARYLGRNAPGARKSQR